VGTAIERAEVEWASTGWDDGNHGIRVENSAAHGYAASGAVNDADDRRTGSSVSQESGAAHH
jgi:hypothetical protein